MCGIIGYVGKESAGSVLLEGLQRLEYRGYDSAGMSIRDSGNAGIKTIKVKGRVEMLWEKAKKEDALGGSCGIGHTRWATHGEPSVINAHPHKSDDGKVVLVHNGIIENYVELREELIEQGYEFASQTDTEVACKLFHYYDQKAGGKHLEAIKNALPRLKGAYAFGILFEDEGNRIYAVKKDSPLIIGHSDRGSFLSSDVAAILKYTNQVHYMEEGKIALMDSERVKLYPADTETVDIATDGSGTKILYEEIKAEENAADKQGYAHFMLKEIHQQPQVVRNLLNVYVKDDRIALEEAGISEELLRAVERVHIVACGSSYHVGMTGKYVMETLADIPVEVDWASEFRYRNPGIGAGTLVILISQSGETADTLSSLRLAKKKGAKTLGIVNVEGSCIAREADICLYTHAGPEISVATTKAYTAQLILIYLLAIKMRQVSVEKEYGKELLKHLRKLPGKMEELLGQKELLKELAEEKAVEKHAFFMGRGIDYTMGMEASLKLKEISYIHSECYPAGELKHGTISLIEEGTLVVGILTQEHLYEKTISNLMEVKSRGAYVVVLTCLEIPEEEALFDKVLHIPATHPLFAASMGILPLQLFSYYISTAKGLDVDRPRNLAKSVTVE